MGMMGKEITAICIILVLASSPAVFAVEYRVGDSRAWTLGLDYDNWVSGKTFRVGDVLVFNYGSSHRVDVVNEGDYDTCGTSNVISVHNDGNTRITLTAPGNMYFICSTPGHCEGGMKLAVSVQAASSGGRTTPSPPSSAGTPTTPATTTSVVPPPPSSNGAVGTVCNVFVVSVVSGIILALMG